MRFNLNKDKSPALALATALRQQGYPVSRDIIRRNLAEAVEYSKVNGIKYAVVISAPGMAEDEVLLVRTSDGARSKIKTADLYTDVSMVTLL